VLGSAAEKGRERGEGEETKAGRGSGERDNGLGGMEAVGEWYDYSPVKHSTVTEIGE
jgi:hypothetical protein